MKKIKLYILFGILFIALVITGINYFIRPFEMVYDVEESVVEEVEEPSGPLVLTREEILERLTVEEKVAQMIAYPLLIDQEEEDKGNEIINRFFFSEDEKDATVSARNSLRLDLLSPGFITIFGDQISSDSAKQKINEVKNLYEDNFLSPRFAVDHEGGSVQRLSGEGYTVLPSWQEMCKMESGKMIEILQESALELRNSGIDIVLSPVLDVGNSSVLKNRICSDSYATVAERSVKYSAVFDSAGISPVVKHFPGIGSVNKDLHDDFDFSEVLINDVKLYKYVIEESPRVAAMVSHVGVVNQDSQVPCSLSESCVNELKTAYPDLLIFSDALEMKSASYNKNNINEPKSLVRISKEAVLAGDEVLIYGQGVTSFEIKDVIFSLSKEYRENSKFKDLVDKAVLKIVDYKYTR